MFADRQDGEFLCSSGYYYGFTTLWPLDACFSRYWADFSSKIQVNLPLSIVLNRNVTSGRKNSFSNSMKNFSKNKLTISLIPLGWLQGEHRSTWSWWIYEAPQLDNGEKARVKRIYQQGRSPSKSVICVIPILFWAASSSSNSILFYSPFVFQGQFWCFSWALGKAVTTIHLLLRDVGFGRALGCLEEEDEHFVIGNGSILPFHAGLWL